jgi:hypothetical protein
MDEWVGVEVMEDGRARSRVGRLGAFGPPYRLNSKQHVRIDGPLPRHFGGPSIKLASTAAATSSSESYSFDSPSVTRRLEMLKTVFNYDTSTESRIIMQPDQPEKKY